jgi:uncharacterized membrane protein
MKRKTRNVKSTKPAAPAAAPSRLRLPQIDALRGGAVVAMIFYHFGFDLNYIHWLQQDLIHDLRWMTARAMILGSFLLAVGMSQALAERQRADLKQRWLRIGKIAGAALLVTLGSRLMFPESAIYFGTLHAIAAISMLLLLLPCRPWVAIPLGVGALVLGNVYANELFNRPALAWLGLMTYKPYTEDYVPLLPWFGVSLIGYGAMQALLREGIVTASSARSMPGALVWAGRHSLAIYLLHQPVLLGILIPLSQWLRNS